MLKTNKTQNFNYQKFTIFFILGIVTFILIIGLCLKYPKQISTGLYNFISFFDETAECNVQGIEIRGHLLTYIPPESLDENEIKLYDETASEDIVYAINRAENDDDIEAIILEIDSPGGRPVASEEIAIAVKNAIKPIVVLIRENGASGGYMVASGADRIFASKYSDVGSIGVTMSYVDYVKQNKEDGITYNSLSAGKYKDAGDYDKILTQEEKDLFMRNINITYKNFIELVAKNRNLDINKVKELADGSTMHGEMALENGLIDQIGGLPEVKIYLKELIDEDVDVCW